MNIRIGASSRWFLFTALILLGAVSNAVSQTDQFSIDKSPLPAPTGYVNDYTGVIDAGIKQQLEEKLTQLKQSSNVEIGVAVVKTTGDRDIFDYSLAVARGWKIGSKDDDNPSALLFVAIDDRKYFTQISRDLEDELPDSLAGSLQRQFLVPQFRQGNYGQGISDTIDAYINAIKTRSSGAAATTTPTPQNPRRSTSGGPGISNIVCCLGIGLLVLLIIMSRAGRGGRGGGNRWGGGGFGGGGSALPWIIGSILSSGVGRSSGSSWGGSSGGWGGGGSSGGFGGFGGGGDFGGGGAGGGW
jgi:uncharacterized protein